MQKVVGVRKAKSAWPLYAAAFILSCLLFAGVLAVMGITPFGNKSLAVVDANIQYLDFYAYLKDVLAGDNSAFYSFSKTLGGNTIGLLSYYLTSPLSLLVVFFPKSQLHLFFTLLVTLKIGLCGLTAAVFLRGRFAGLHRYYILLLSLGYALMQYNLAQNSNVMWLDGVYMLPLILLGVYRLLRENKRALLIASVACSLLFNWYSAGINCLFSALYFLYELLLCESAPLRNGKQTLLRVWRYGYSMLLGLGCSMCLFFPTLLALGNGRAGADTKILSLDFIGNVFSAVQNYTVGALESKGSVSLFCGSLILLGCIGFFFARQIPRRVKIITGAALAVTLLLFYWQPFVFVFSLLKTVASYWYRYSYVGVMMLLVVAAWFFQALPEEKRNYGLLGKGAAGFAAVLLVLDYVHSVYSLKATYFTVLLCICIAAGVGFLGWCRRKGRYVKLAAVVLAGVVCVESAVNACLVLRVYGTADQAAYVDYVEQQEKQIDALQAYDDDFYRVNQTSTRIMNEGTNLTANYNEAFAFNYPSISGYTSVSDNNQREFLARLGYRCENLNTMNIVNTSILPADSLLGVRYVLSAYPVQGLERIDSLGCFNGKYVYKNPYCLPMAFTYTPDGRALDEEEDNPFVYQNGLYSYLLGRKVELFRSIQPIRRSDADGVEYELSLPEGEIAVYGYIDTDRSLDAMVYADGELLTGYAMWKSPRVFYIPAPGEGEHVTTVRLEAENAADGITEEAFYYLDLALLEEVSAELTARAAENLILENGNVSCTVTAREGQRLYLSVPVDDGWKVMVNGRTVQTDSIGGCMMSLPLDQGENQISLRYTVPGLYLGIAVSVGSLAVCILLLLRRRWREKANRS